MLITRQVTEACLKTCAPTAASSANFRQEHLLCRSIFRLRNRLLSGLSLGSVVVEAPKKSGALITARHALEQGRDVFTLPGNLGNPTCEGNIQLLKEGAILIAEGWDVLQEYTYLYPELPLRQKPIGPMTLSQQETKDNLVVAETPSNPEKTDTKAVDKLENRAYIDVQEILPHVSARRSRGSPAAGVAESNRLTG